MRGLFSSCSERGLLFVAVRGLLIAVASLVAEHGLQSAGSVVVAHGLSCSAACGIFLDQDSNPCPLHWQADSQPLRHQGSSLAILLMNDVTFLLRRKSREKSMDLVLDCLDFQLGFHCLPAVGPRQLLLYASISSLPSGDNNST